MYRMLMFSYLQAPAGLGDHSDLDGKCPGSGEHCEGPLRPRRSLEGSLARESGGGWASRWNRQTGSAPGASGSVPTGARWRGRPGC